MRARRREINIFNMSLLDILCGALGAFCFMMLVALPYYIPPGSGLELRKAQKETDRLLLLIEKFKDKLPDQKSVEEMEKLMRELEAQVKALQGRVNILTAEKEELKKRADQLGAENQQLKAQVAQLASEKQALQAQVDQLAAEKKQLAEQNQLLQAKNQELTQENGNLKTQLQQKLPLTLMALAEDQMQSIDLVTLTKSQAKDSSPFFKNWLAGHFDMLNELRLELLRARGIAVGVLSDRPPEAELKLYVRLTSPAAIQRNTNVQCAMFGDIRFDSPMKIGKVTLEPGHNWEFVGTLTIDKNSRLSFKEATSAERAAEWLRLTGTTPTPTPTPAPTPTDAERSAAEATRAKAEAKRRQFLEARQNFGKLMRIPLDESGKNDAEILQLTEQILRDLPPNDGLRREAQFRREHVLELKKRREGGRSPSPSPNDTVSPWQGPPAPVPAPTR